jgi:hypothetical protein
VLFYSNWDQNLQNPPPLFALLKLKELKYIETAYLYSTLIDILSYLMYKKNQGDNRPL